jgi:hypothetical protein
MREISGQFLTMNLEGIDRLEDVDKYGNIILKRILEM